MWQKYIFLVPFFTRSKTSQFNKYSWLYNQGNAVVWTAGAWLLQKHDLVTAAGIKPCSQNSKNQRVERHKRPALYDGTAQRSSTRARQGEGILAEYFCTLIQRKDAIKVVGRKWKFCFLYYFWRPPPRWMINSKGLNWKHFVASSIKIKDVSRGGSRDYFLDIFYFLW